MLLTVDIGNTNILVGLFRGEDLIEHWRLATEKNRTPDEIGLLMLSLFREVKIKPQVEDIIISSVVPPLNNKFVGAFEKYFKRTPKFLSFDSALIKMDVEEPSAVGSDRIANSIAGYHIYGGPILIIDFGTAVTFDLVSEEGVFLGGAIAPEMELAASALFHKAALLPMVELELPESVIGKNTQDNIKAGFVLGFIDMIRGLIDRFKEHYPNLKVIATGGKGEIFYKNIEAIEKYDPFLTLRGLMIARSL
jgi:type III pantothenate kinase